MTSRYAAQPVKRRPLWERRNVAYFVFLSPWLLGFVLWIGGPLIASIYLSFTQYDILTPPQWVGLENYRQLFTDDLFWQALKVTSIYTFVGVPLMMVDFAGAGRTA